MSDLVPAGVFGNTVEAQYAKAALEGDGITAFLDGDAAGVTLGHLGSGLSGIKVLVPEAVADRARVIVEGLKQPAGSEEWFCGKCEEVIEPGFLVCWSCGGAKDDVSAPPREPTIGTREDRPPRKKFGSNPYEAASELQGEPGDELSRDLYEEPPEEQIDVEAEIERAWRATLFGIIFFPLLFWGAWVLMGIANRPQRLTPELRKRYRRAVVVCFIFFLPSFLLLLVTFFRLLLVLFT
jgi:hypothetical protein